MFNVGTDQYVRNAEVRVEGTEDYVFTESDGSFAIPVPAGPVRLTASYSGAQSLTLSISAMPFTPNTHDFDLQPVIIDATVTTTAATTDADAATTTETAGPVVVLDRYHVTADREGQAKAIMDQRAAMNAVTIIAADNYGDVTMGSMGEILKYIPGITLDYSGEEDVEEATGVRIGGLDPKYTTAALDGVAVTTSGRSLNLVDLTTTGIETIEFVQTLVASMEAGAAAGRLNFVTRDPFSRRSRQIRYQFGLNGHSSALSWGGAYLPDDRKHNLIFPSAQIGYGDVLLANRLAIDMNVSYNGTYNLTERHHINYAYRNPGEKNPDIHLLGNEPVISMLSWIPYIQLVERYGGNLNIAYKLTPHLTSSVRSGFAYDERESYAVSINLRAYNSDAGSATYAPASGVDLVNSSLTHWVVNRDGTIDSRLMSQTRHNHTTTLTKFATPRLAYKRGSFSADLYGGYTGSIKRTRDTDRGFFNSSNTSASNISWVADRPSTSSPIWTLRQTDGDPWNNPENWNKIAPGVVRMRPDWQNNDQYAGGLDLAYARRIFDIPVTFKAGGLLRRNEYSYHGKSSSFYYLGPTGDRLEAITPHTQNYRYAFSLGGKAGNINNQGWRTDDTYATYDIYRDHPDWFAPSTILDNARNELTSKRDLTEDITAGYFELNSRVNRLRVNLGARFEGTAVETLNQLRRLDSEVREAGYDPSTADGFLYQYYYGQRIKRHNSYSNIFLSGGLKYDITRNLQAQVSFSQSILRPDYGNLSRVLNYNESSNYRTVTVPNSKLKPEYMDKFYAGLNWRLEPAGHFSLYVYRMDIKDKQIRDVDIPRAEAEELAGYPLSDAGIAEDDEFGDGTNSPSYTETIFRTAKNSTSKLSVYGVTAEYSQQLKFLPGYLKGLSVFGSVTLSDIRGVQTSTDRIGQVRRSANGGLKYRVGRMNLQLRGTWRGDYLAAVTSPSSSNDWFLNDHQYEEARLMVDLSGVFKLTDRYELSFSIRNLTNTPRIRYSNEPDRLSSYALSGSIWNVSLKGSF